MDGFNLSMDSATTKVVIGGLLALIARILWLNRKEMREQTAAVKALTEKLSEHATNVAVNETANALEHSHFREKHKATEAQLSRVHERLEAHDRKFSAIDAILLDVHGRRIVPDSPKDTK